MVWNHKVSRPGILLWLVELLGIRFLLQKMEYRGSWLAILLRIFRLLSIFPLPAKAESYGPAAYFYHFSCYPWANYLLCDRLFLSNSLHPFCRARYSFLYLGILFMQLATLRRSSVNLIFWLEMYIGMAIMMTLYLVECFARQKISD